MSQPWTDEEIEGRLRDISSLTAADIEALVATVRRLRSERDAAIERHQAFLEMIQLRISWIDHLFPKDKP